MNKIATFASAAALAAVSLSASAWWANPYPTCLTEEQKQAMAEQQQAAAEQQAKAYEQMITAQRQMAEQFSVQQAEMVKRAQEQGFNPANMGYPMSDYPAMPEMPQFGQMPELPAMPEFGQMPELPAAPQFGQMPELPAMPEFGQMPEFAHSPAMPEIPARSEERRVRERV